LAHAFAFERHDESRDQLSRFANWKAFLAEKDFDRSGFNCARSEVNDSSSREKLQELIQAVDGIFQFSFDVSYGARRELHRLIRSQHVENDGKTLLRPWVALWSFTSSLSLDSHRSSLGRLSLASNKPHVRQNIRHARNARQCGVLRASPVL